MEDGRPSPTPPHRTVLTVLPYTARGRMFAILADEGLRRPLEPPTRFGSGTPHMWFLHRPSTPRFSRRTSSFFASPVVSVWSFQFPENPLLSSRAGALFPYLAFRHFLSVLCFQRFASGSIQSQTPSQAPRFWLRARPAGFPSSGSPPPFRAAS